MVDNQKIIFIEGNIGSGKTTLLNRIPEFLDNCQVILEPIDNWTKLTDSDGKNILEHFYTDMEKNAYAFQSLAFLTRTQSLQKIDKTKKYIFVERSIHSDRNIFAKNCYMSGVMSEIHYNLYNEWFKWMENMLNLKNTHHVYLRCNPEISYERVQKRSRGEENTVELSYLKDIYNRHEEWLMKDDNTIVLDASTSFNVDDNEMKRLISRLIADNNQYTLNYIM